MTIDAMIVDLCGAPTCPKCHGTGRTQDGPQCPVPTAECCGRCIRAMPCPACCPMQGPRELNVYEED